MVKSAIKRLTSLLPFSLTYFLILGLLIIAIRAILLNYKNDNMLEVLQDPYLQYAIKFNVFQATLSSFIAIILAIPIARSLHRRKKFFARNFILYLVNTTFTLPAIILSLGVIIIHGRHGWLNSLLEFTLNTSFKHYLYGICGVIIGHLSFCLPLAIKLILNDLDNIAQENWKLSTQLSFSSYKLFKYVEWPAIRNTTLSAFMLIFMMCFTSFVIIMTLGGGPSVTTLEVAVFQAIKFEFNLHKASILSIIQLLICLFMIIIINIFNLPILSYNSQANSKITKFKRVGKDNGLNKFIDIFFITVLVVIAIFPLVAVMYHGISEKLITILYSDKFLNGLKQSILIATYAAILTVTMSLSLVSGAFYMKYSLNKPQLAGIVLSISYVRMILPSFVFATAMFLILNDFVFVMNNSFYILVVMTAVAALPFATNILWSNSLSFTNNEINLCRSLNLSYINFIRYIYYPRVRRSLAYAFAFSMAISWGDVSIIALFSNKDLNTLPYMLYKMLNNYRIEEAVIIASIMILLSYLFFWFVDEFWGENKNARA